MRSWSTRIFAFILFVLPASYVGAQCTLNQADPSVTICQPANGAIVPSPVHIVAGSHSSSPVAVMQVYGDGFKKYEMGAAPIDPSLSMTNGAHRLSVQGVNAA